MRLNFTALTVSAALCLAGMTTFAPAAPISTESSDSTGSLLSRIFGQSSNDTSNAKPTKRARVKNVAKKATGKNAEKPAQPESAAIAEAVRDFLTNNQGLLRTAIIDVLRGDKEIQKMVAAPADKSAAPQSSAAPPQAAPTDQVRVEEIVRNYLLVHPEVLQEAIGELEKRQALAEAEKHRTAVKENSEVLFNSPRQVVLGNPRGDVTFVEFFDYNCGYCKKAYSDMMTLIKTDAKLKVVLKEFPVLGKGSTEAAQVAVAVRMQDKTGKKYLEFHQKLLMARAPADHDRAIAVAKEIGMDMARLEKDMASEEARASIEESLKLASELGLNGTPSYVVGPEVVVGAVGLDALREKVNTARCGKSTC
jgi:protein-disulfide isomerase